MNSAICAVFLMISIVALFGCGRTPTAESAVAKVPATSENKVDPYAGIVWEPVVTGRMWGCTDPKGTKHFTNVDSRTGGDCKYRLLSDRDSERVERDANAGEASAQYLLGLRYWAGDGAEKDSAKSIDLWNKAASQGYALAQSALAEAYSSGVGVTKDPKKAVELWEKAASDPEPMFSGYAKNFLAEAYLKGLGVPKNVGKAIAWWEKGAKDGNAFAQYRLGWVYSRGLGAPKDDAKAFAWWQKCAEKGDSACQYALGASYWNGTGVPRDFAKAVEWFQKAAQSGQHEAPFWLAAAYVEAKGVAKDLVLAYAWFNIAAAKGNADAGHRRDQIQLSPALRAEAERLSSKWNENGWESKPLIAREDSAPPDVAGARVVSPPTKKGFGTGFLVTKDGHAVTNHHVVDGCKEVRVQGREGIVKVQVTDSVNDLALLIIPGVVNSASTISAKPSNLRQGDEIVVFGFPLNSVLSSAGNLTPGVVSAPTGLGNNSNQLQITAAIQPGSSGSPLINKKGEIVGVVSAKISDNAMAKATGQIAQNVNFAVSGQTLKAFLEAHKIEYRTGGLFSFKKTNAEIADDARTWTLLLECWK